jgi:hypothetical protein
MMPAASWSAPAHAENVRKLVFDPLTPDEVHLFATSSTEFRMPSRGMRGSREECAVTA